ncbi:LysM peptidoglycan-binding domain-containing protein [Tengunoibacter tsumagoiensis]|uniref:Peptidase C51 domain-containing protein n=1 Tax=Tengunoibacter tsumagoiensis TaxID=2014871 RepID=A0A401ZUK8_9CHLR|nr:LysM domain-containing protein [Tengunoibacter tsumagoiensis]GCE10482.1 hypothetical protein KTT_03410 [Tengunoibacter tsumagoiensis]
MKASRVRNYLNAHRVTSTILGYVVVMTVFSAVLGAGAFGSGLFHAHAAAACPQGDKTYTVVPGDTLNIIGENNGTSWQTLATHNNIADPDLIYVDQQICIPQDQQAATMTSTVNTVAVQTADLAYAAPVAPKAPAARHGGGNPYPYGQCTFWASQRYSQVHGFYVPWTTNSNAWQWVARARENNWTVSTTPKVGDIIVLQPWVQGAYNLGHVAFVEKVQPNGSVIASNMNWAGSGARVVNSTFKPGAGVAFLSAN